MTNPDIRYWSKCFRCAMSAAIDAKQYLHIEAHGGTPSRQDLELIYRSACITNEFIEDLIDTINHRLEKKDA